MRGAAAALFATLGLGLGACATVPVAETPLVAGRASGPREARVLEALGQFDGAWAAGLPGGAPRAGDRWAAARLLGMIDRVGPAALTPAVFERVLAAGPTWSELAVAIAARLGNPGALARAERARGTVFRVRRSGRLAAWPGAVPWGARVGTGAGYGEPMAYHAGQLASPEEGPGLYGFLIAPPSSEAATYAVEVRADGAFKAYVGGREVAANLRHRVLAPERVRFTVELGPGAPLEILVWDRANVARAELALVPTGAAGRASGSDVSVGAGAEPLAALELALADGDLGALDAATARLGSDPLSALGRAEALFADATRPPTMAREAARQALETLVALHPELTEARERLGELLLADGELAEAQRVLNGLPESEAVLTLAEQSGDTLAVQRLARAWSEHAPRSCLAAGWRTGDDAGAGEIGQTLAATRGPCFEAAMRAGERLVAARALDAAERVARRLVAALDPGPERARAAMLTATLALARGDHAAAATAAETALSDGGVRAAALELLTRARRLAGLPVVATRDAGWELLRRSLDPARDLGLPLADARPVILAVLGKPVQGEAAETIRDDRFVRVLPDGGQIIRTHTIMRLSSPQAVAQLGELTVPDGAELLLARTWKAPAKAAAKPSGTTPGQTNGKPSGQNGKPPGAAALRPLEPEDIGDKATISFPAVAGGDFVEWAYFRYVPPDPRVAPGWAFQHAFDAETGPVHSARLTLSLAPGATPPSFVADPRVPAPTHPDSTTWLWIADGLPRYVPEALDPRPDLRAVTLHAWAGVSPIAWGEAARAELTPLALVTPAVRAFVAEALRGTAAETDAARLAALQRHLDKAITPEDVALTASNASHVALRGRGERALLFWSACRALGLGCELVLARPLSEGPMPPLPPAPGGWPDPEGFSYPLVRAPADRGALWFDPGARFQPFATLLPNLEGVDALALGDDGVEMIRTPINSGGANGAPPGGANGVPPGADNGTRQTTIELVVAADGKTFTASGSERLTGLYGAAWRANLVALSPVEREQALIHIVQARLPDVVQPVITLDGLTDPEAALVWRFTAHGSAPTARKRARLLVGLAPEGIARATIVVAERKTPLLVNRSVDSETTLTVTIPATFQFAPPPADVHVAHPSLAFERIARLATGVASGASGASGASAPRAGTRALTIQKRLHVRPAIIAPEDYPAWIRAAIPADRGEIVELGWGLGLDP